MKRVESKIKYNLSLQDVQRAIKMYIESYGEVVQCANIRIIPEYIEEEHSIGVYATGTNTVFDGLSVEFTEEKE